jgi:hypothetical protein
VGSIVDPAWEEEMQQEDVTEFKGQLRGDLIEPTDVEYENERKVYNAVSCLLRLVSTRRRLASARFRSCEF